MMHIYPHEQKARLARQMIERYSESTGHPQEQTVYVQQSTCVAVKQKHLITAHLRVCSALAITVDDVNLLAHISAMMPTDVITSEFEKHIALSANSQVGITLWLGESSATIHHHVVESLYKLNLLDHLFNVAAIKELFNRYYDALEADIKSHPDLAPGYSAWDDFTTTGFGVHPIAQAFFELDNLGTSEAIETFTHVLNILNRACPLDFANITGNRVKAVSSDMQIVCSDATTNKPEPLRQQSAFKPPQP